MNKILNHLKENWVRHGFETLVVTVGILGAFALNNWNDIRDGKLQGQMFKPINPIFGFRGRSPIEREKTLDFQKVLRFVSAIH